MVEFVIDEARKDQLKGDIAAFLIDRLRSWECAYRYMNEAEQQTAISDANRSAEHLIDSVSSLIASDGQEVVRAEIVKVVNDGKKIQINLEAPKESEHRHVLFDATGAIAHIALTDPEKFKGGDGPEPEPDQPSMLGEDRPDFPDEGEAA